MQNQNIGLKMRHLRSLSSVAHAAWIGLMLKRYWLILALFTSMMFSSTCFGNDDFLPSSTDLQIFVEPDAGHDPILDLLNEAEKSIRMEMYLLTDEDIIDALKDARKRGVDVRLILEERAYQNESDFKAVLDELNKTKISVMTSNPAFFLTHEKAIVIDDRVGVIMTLNQDRKAFTKNREFGIIDRHPNEVAEITSVFEADWNRTPAALSDSDLIWSPESSREKILALIDGAENTLEIENEEMQDAEVEEHLITAVARGVDVRVVMSPTLSGEDANAQGQNKITEAGAKLHLVEEPYIHAKIIIADNSTAFVGSQNFSPTSLDKNRELGLLVRDPAIIEVLLANFEKDWREP